MRPVVFALALAGSGCLSGCLTDELLKSHAEPGGTVVAAIGSAPQRTCPALLDDTVDPITLNGFSATLTFGLVGALDAGGAAVQHELATYPTTLVITIEPGGNNQLEIHADGGGCSAKSATVNLRVDTNGYAQGDFAVSAGTDTASGAPCVFAGSLTNIPVSR